MHTFIPTKELGKQFNTRTKLLSHPKVSRFVKWVSTQQAARVRTKTRRSR